MLVGTKQIPINDLAKKCTSVDDLVKYSISLVPRFARHIDEIVDNQKYLVAVKVRDIVGLPYKFKKILTEGLLKGVVVRGTVNTVVDMEDLLTSIDMDEFMRSIFKEELKQYCDRD
jgi:hypothetical protein